MTRKTSGLSEFDLIKTYFAPLTAGEPGAARLTDDCAVQIVAPGHEFVITADAIVAGVHFLPDDPAGDIAQKALGVNLSDLAAKGAQPRSYLLSLVLPRGVRPEWIHAFAAGLKQSQRKYGVTLIGGDTTASDGPLVVSITALGEVKVGATVRRSGAKLGDDVWVTGTIGDAGVGLRLAQGGNAGLPDAQADFLMNRYRVPQPRCAFGHDLSNFAHGSVDVSDGLVADLNHLCQASRVGMKIALAAIPISKACERAIALGCYSVEAAITAGDDYEIAFTAAVTQRKAVMASARKARTKVSRVGTVVQGSQVQILAESGEIIQVARTGFRHF